eukprot:CAMPEP_0114523302 /NCGR_PEP_ID=MMETSP0109-20121206/21218_1 /TAXON_ID=29199 /ORGANISM="Chlorarachnion reptans, Strain CCCM449" /LENGTH=91 /DNA_ID=CAMNT_0001704607 /DNA_START=341 /DNA_END=612 /DNA_ORIENTATION=+
MLLEKIQNLLFGFVANDLLLDHLVVGIHEVCGWRMAANPLDGYVLELIAAFLLEELLQIPQAVELSAAATLHDYGSDGGISFGNDGGWDEG